MSESTRSGAPAVPGVRLRTGLFAYSISCALVAAMAYLGTLFQVWLPSSGMPLLFMVAVLASAVSFGFWPGMTSAALAFATYNFFFVEPVYTLRVASAADMMALGVFLLAAGLTGSLAGRMRDEADSANRRAAYLSRLSHFAAELGECRAPQAVYEATCRNVSALAGMNVIVLTQENGHISLAAAQPAGAQLDDASLQASERAIRYGRHEPATAAGWPGSRYEFYPLMTDPAAVAGVQLDHLDRSRAAEIELTVSTMITQSQAALTRIAQAAKAEAARALADREALRSALLLSLSHDLRTPLATILGSVSSLRELGGRMSESVREDLLAATEEETKRLARYVDDLLAMTRINSGLKPNLVWSEPQDIAMQALSRARSAHPEATFNIWLAATLPLTHTDAALVEQSLFNLLDNAAKFSGADKPVDLKVTRNGPLLRFTVSDQGPGMDEATAAKAFDPLFRSSDRGKAGTGLGLAIVKAIAGLLGGDVRFESPAEGGARFTFEVPSGGAPFTGKDAQ